MNTTPGPVRSGCRGGEQMPRDGNMVWYSVGQTLNTGQYESVRLDVGEQRVVAEGEDADEVFEELRGAVD